MKLVFAKKGEFVKDSVFRQERTALINFFSGSNQVISFRHRSRSILLDLMKLVFFKSKSIWNGKQDYGPNEIKSGL